MEASGNTKVHKLRWHPDVEGSVFLDKEESTRKGVKLTPSRIQQGKKFLFAKSEFSHKKTK